MDERGYRVDRWGRVKIFSAVVVVVFAVALAVIVSQRLSDESLAVLAGAVCGVGAAIPTSLLIVAVSRRREEPRATQNFASQGGYPPVVVVTGPGTHQQASGWQGLPPSLSAPTGRHFTVVGGTVPDREGVPHEHYR
jgi:hypothetical protein